MIGCNLHRKDSEKDFSCECQMQILHFVQYVIRRFRMTFAASVLILKVKKVEEAVMGIVRNLDVIILIEVDSCLHRIKIILTVITAFHMTTDCLAFRGIKFFA